MSCKHKRQEHHGSKNKSAGAMPCAVAKCKDGVTGDLKLDRDGDGKIHVWKRMQDAAGNWAWMHWGTE